MICDKMPYPSMQAAIDAAKAINDRKRESQHAYKCKECGLFHNATRGKRHGIKNIYKPSSQTLPAIRRQPAPLGPPKKIIRPTTERMISKEQAEHLKRLIAGSNAVENQKRGI